MTVNLQEHLDATGVPVGMPGTSDHLRSALLHRDHGDGRSMVVGFPVGFSMPHRCRFEQDEEFIVISGSLVISGITLRPGDWAWIPESVERCGIGSPQGAIVYAWFGGSVKMTLTSVVDDRETGDSRAWHHAPLEQRPGELRPVTPKAGGSWSVAPGQPLPAGSFEALDWRSGTWRSEVHAESRLPNAGESFVRFHPAPAAP